MKLPSGYEKILKRGFTEKNGVAFFSPPPDDVQPAWGTPEERGDQKTWTYWRKQNYDFFVEKLSNTGNKVVADIGTGQFYFRNAYRSDAIFTLDFYPYPDVNVVASVGNSLPFEDKSIDVVTLSNVLEHVAEPKFFLQECSRVLKKGGVLLGAVPFIAKVHQRPYDYFRYTDIALNHMLKEAGFPSIDVVPVMNTWAVTFSFLAQFLESQGKGNGNWLLKQNYRVIWKLLRMVNAVAKPQLQQSTEDKDFALGYHFEAKR